MKKDGLFVFGIFLALAGMVFIFYKMPFLMADGAETGFLLLPTLDGFFDMEFNEMVVHIKEFDPLYLLQFSSYLLIVGVAFGFLFGAAASKISAIRILNVFICIMLVVAIAAGVYSLVKYATGYYDFGEEKQKVTYWAYIYYSIGLLAIILLSMIGKKKREKEANN